MLDNFVGMSGVSLAHSDRVELTLTTSTSIEVFKTQAEIDNLFKTFFEEEVNSLLELTGA